MKPDLLSQVMQTTDSRSLLHLLVHNWRAKFRPHADIGAQSKIAELRNTDTENALKKSLEAGGKRASAQSSSKNLKDALKDWQYLRRFE